MQRSSSSHVCCLLAVALALIPADAPAQDAMAAPADRQAREPTAAELAWTSRYELPPESVRRLFDVDKGYAVLDNLSPDGRHFLLPDYTELSTLERMGRPTLRLAMLELRPDGDRTWRLDTYGIRGLSVFDLETRQQRAIALPDDGFVSDMTWSPNGDRVAFLWHGRWQTEVWTAVVATGEAARLADAAVMATLATSSQGVTPRQSEMLQWTPDGGVITLLVPADRGPAPERGLATGPLVRRSRPDETPTRTQPFLLQDATDAASFRHYTTSQIAELRQGRPPRTIGEPGMYESLSLSPDGKHLLAERIAEPLSPITSARSFGRVLEVLDMDGAVQSVIRESPLQEAIDGDDDSGCDLAREVAWLPAGSTLGYLQRPPDCEENADDDEMVDRILLLGAPFDPQAARVAATREEGFSGLAFTADGGRAFASASRDDDRSALITFDLSAAEPTAVSLTADYDPAKRLEHPGDLVARSSGNGHSWVRVTDDGGSVLVQGLGYREDLKPRPFVDRVPLAGGDPERLFEGSDAMLDQPLVMLDDDAQRLVVSRESVTDFPNSYLWTRADGSFERLTDNADPFPEITAARRIDFEFTRRDGMAIHGRISMPVGWRQEDPPVPAIFWTYPREYADDDAYRDATLDGRWNNEFTHLSYLRWSDIWLTQGYALVYPDVPIIGDPYNDNYIQHLSDSLYAAIRKVDAMGLVDVDRIGHGGHSYGAFATANLLARTPYFKAGIAGDGAYNRTLTPMSFQREDRFLWQAEDTYLEMSPFFQADHIDTPLLMYHGADDNNSGTYPIQSRRMMQALTGLGKTAVLYEYPYESHGPRAIESYLDLWKRWLDWFDRYVKAPGEDGDESS